MAVHREIVPPSVASTDPQVKLHVFGPQTVRHLL